jgi:hypothetical protein
MDGGSRNLTSSRGGRRQILTEQGQSREEQLSGSSDILAQDPTYNCVSMEPNNTVNLEGTVEDGISTDLDVQALIDLHNPPKNEYPLHQIGKLPHTPHALEQARLFRSLGSLHLLTSSFPRGHHIDGGLAPRLCQWQSSMMLG